ncbi:MAG TPA: shikimate dehydrogenase [Phycisphaerae bacterium]|nr:shikimate dehydrogenase [Phycisphaerae bacterium]HRY69612.1 shikimate dehydrogenase [Phycisphaerae bacterium]HSA27273.1 shikimate dehydrogenase [Phycisphaerae bacterium]
MTTKLCVPLTANTYERMAADIRAATAAQADMIELRLDHLRDHDLASLRRLMDAARSFPGELIVTCRMAEEGGRWDGDESGRVSLMELAGLCGAHYLDFEYEAWRRSANIRQKIGLVCDVNTDSSRPRARLILSKHDFERTPDDPASILADIAREPAHVVKLACKANKITDSLLMLEALRASAAVRPTIALSMGEAGILARVLARKWGAVLTFASLEAGQESAPGQVPVTQMREMYRWDALNAETRVYGVIGCPVAHSMSPAIMNAAFGEVGHNGVYLPMRVEPDYTDFRAFVDGCLRRPWLDLRGCSVTIPHKQNLLRYVEERGGDIEPLARRIGAANTLSVEKGTRPDGSDARVSASNTDYRGAMDALMAGLAGGGDLGDAAVVVLGAGGASRAIVAGLRDAGCRVTICNRTADKARALADEFQATARPWNDRGRLEADVVVNCTSIGMWPKVDESPLPGGPRLGKMVVFDTIYNPIETQLLRDARERGCRTIDGVAMFVNQAAAQFQIWTGIPAPTATIRLHLVQRLGR